MLTTFQSLKTLNSLVDALSIFGEEAEPKKLHYGQLFLNDFATKGIIQDTSMKQYMEDLTVFYDKALWTTKES